MVRAYHVIITAYGFWLPNDQRGSWSDFVRRWELVRFGKATKIDPRSSVAARPFDRSRRAAARSALLYPAVSFTGQQALAIARAFAAESQKCGYILYACAILPLHIHLVIARHRYPIEQVTNRLKGAATRRLASDGLHPLAQYQTRSGTTPSPWAVGLWKVFLNDDAEIRRAVRYVQDNPEKEGKRLQQWSFVASTFSAHV